MRPARRPHTGAPLTNIAGDDFDAGRAVIHHPEGHGAARREYGALSEDARKDMLREVFAHWSLNCNLAVRQFWHTASVLGFPSRHARPEAHHARRRDLPVPPSADVAAELQKATGDD